MPANDGRDEDEYVTGHERLHDDEVFHTEDEELALADDDERLPWLESAEYDDEGQSGVGTGRLVLFAVLGLALLALLIAAIWYFTNQGAEPDRVADGSMIEAPDEPYKERPEEAGGREVEGTGDTSFAVGEGETREGRLAEDDAGAEDETTDEVPRPSIDAATTANAGEPQEAASSPAPAAASGVAVQVGAYSTQASARTGWTRLQAQTDKLNGVEYRIVKGQADIGTVYRLQALAGDGAAARSLCDALKADGVACQVKN